MVYDYACPECGKTFEGYNRVANRATHVCDCGATALLKFSIKPIQVTPVIHEFVERHFGPKPVLVRGRTHKRQLLKELGLVQTG